jgi:hypothetical protein
VIAETAKQATESKALVGPDANKVGRSRTSRLGTWPREWQLQKAKCWLDVTALSPFLDREVFNVDVPRTLSTSIRVHVDGSLVIYVQKCRPDGGKPTSILLDTKYLAIFAASTIVMNSLFVLLVTTVDCSFDSKVMVPPAKQKDNRSTSAQAGGMPHVDETHNLQELSTLDTRVDVCY